MYEGLAFLVGVLHVEADDRRHAGPHEIRVSSLGVGVGPSVLVASPLMLYGDGLNFLPRYVLDVLPSHLYRDPFSLLDYLVQP